MSDKISQSRASFSHENSGFLPGEPIRTADNARSAFQEARQESKIERRASFMVTRQAPQPVQRPSPSLALGSDRAVFNQQWERECTKADRHTKRAAFIAKRQPSITNRFQKRSH